MSFTVSEINKADLAGPSGEHVYKVIIALRWHCKPTPLRNPSKLLDYSVGKSNIKQNDTDANKHPYTSSDFNC